jgi:hypothetical protein
LIGNRQVISIYILPDIQECVICGTVYVSDDGVDEYSQLRVINSPNTLDTVAPIFAARAPVAPPETANGVSRYQALYTSNESPIVVSPASPMEPSKVSLTMA